jgi:hypothetical protein
MRKVMFALAIVAGAFLAVGPASAISSRAAIATATVGPASSGAGPCSRSMMPRSPALCD